MALKPLLTALTAAVLLGCASAALAEDPSTPDMPLPGDVQVSQPATGHHKSNKVHGSSNLSVAPAPMPSASGKPAGKHKRHAAPAKTRHSHAKASHHGKVVKAAKTTKTTKTNKAAKPAKITKKPAGKPGNKTARKQDRHTGNKTPAKTKRPAKQPAVTHGKQHHAKPQARSKVNAAAHKKVQRKKPAKN